MNSIRTLLAGAAFTLAFTVAAQAGELDFKPPNLNNRGGQDVGVAQIGVSFKAMATFHIDSAGISFNPFGNQTGLPAYATDQLIVYIYRVVNGEQGSLIISKGICGDGSLPSHGSCSLNEKFPSNGVPGILPNFFDINPNGHGNPVEITFKEGETYLVEFGVLPDGWGEVETVKNWVEFYTFDPNIQNAPPDQGSIPFPVPATGPTVATALDGWFSADHQNKNFPHIRLNATIALACPAQKTGKVGVPYPASPGTGSLVASQGVGPNYSYSVGSLPMGLSLNMSTGSITGTPMTAGTTTFLAQAIDLGPPHTNSIQAQCTITIAK